MHLLEHTPGTYSREQEAALDGLLEARSRVFKLEVSIGFRERELADLRSDLEVARRMEQEARDRCLELT